jgi:uridine phosphorylase
VLKGELLMPERAWYLGATSAQVADRALLVGDPERVDRIADRLEDPVRLTGNRALRAVTGTFGTTPITAAAFGMGAPIAAILVHELRCLGTRCFLRLGTAMTFRPGGLGELLVSEAAIRGESTSGTYVPDGFPAAADHELEAATRAELERTGLRWRAGLFASYDGFYTQMLALTEPDRRRLTARMEELARLGVIALDMETSAVLAVGRALGARAACLCLATVAWEGPRTLGDRERELGEQRLIDVGLRILASFDHAQPGGGGAAR